MDAVIEIAVRKLGYSEAKEFQTKSIEEFVSEKDVFVSVPTNLFDKSIFNFSGLLSKNIFS